MNLFLDNDVLLKLASWNLLEEGVRACGFERAAVRHLPTTRFWLGLAGKKNSKHPPEVQERLTEFLAVAKACNDDPAEGDAALPLVNDVDPGDAILFAQAARSSGALLATGDKRCIRAVAGAPTYASIVALMAGRVLCLEQVLLRAITNIGFEEVKGRVVGSNQLTLDTAVRAAFGSGMEADQFNACGSLEGRVRSLAADAGGMLAAQEYRFGGEGGGA